MRAWSRRLISGGHRWRQLAATASASTSEATKPTNHTRVLRKLYSELSSKCEGNTMPESNVDKYDSLSSNLDVPMILYSVLTKVENIAAGGFGIVYCAKHPDWETVAFKELIAVFISGWAGTRGKVTQIEPPQHCQVVWDGFRASTLRHCPGIRSSQSPWKGRLISFHDDDDDVSLKPEVNFRRSQLETIDRHGKGINWWSNKTYQSHTCAS